MDDKALRTWVTDQLFALLGFAENSLAGFVVALGACTRFRHPHTPVSCVRARVA